MYAILLRPERMLTVAGSIPQHQVCPTALQNNRPRFGETTDTLSF